MKKNFIATLFLGVATTVSFAEVSVFDAGNIDNNNPYGLTEKEKVLLHNKEKVDNLNKNFGSVENRLNNLQEQVEGLQSIIEGLNSRIGNFEKRITALENKVGVDSNSNQSQDLRTYVEESRKIQEENNQRITKALTELSTIIDSINSNYVSKTELNGAKKQKKDEKQPDKKDEKQVPEAKETSLANDDFSKIQPKDLMNDAEKMYSAGKIDDAEKRFSYLLSKQHKPARASFILGEIAYKKKNYNNAISYYKQSISLYDKAEYTPQLLYHTAISLDKIGDKNNANEFYKALKTNYPDSKEAKSAPKR